MYPSPYSSGLKRRRRRRVRGWVLALVLVLTAGSGMALLLATAPRSRVQAALPPESTENPELRTAVDQINSQNKEVSRWTMTVANQFGTFTITDEEICKKYQHWYEYRNREFEGCGSPFDNECTITFNDDSVARFEISSDDSRVMRSTSEDAYQILSDNIYDELQNALIAQGGTLNAADNPASGRYTVPNEDTSLAAFPPEKQWDTSGWAIVVSNESGQAVLTGLASECQQLVSYASSLPAIATDPGEFDNRLTVVRDGKEVLRLYAAGGEVLLTEDQSTQMAFPEAIAERIEGALSAHANSLYEGGRFALASTSAAGEANDVVEEDTAPDRIPDGMEANDLDAGGEDGAQAGSEE